MAAKVKGTKLFYSQFGGEQPIPPEFIAAMERAETVQAVPNDVGPEALDGQVVESKVETNRTDERVRKTVRKKPGNITLREINTNNAGQPVQVTRTLFPTGTTPAVPTATQSVAVKDLGNGWSIEEVGIEGSYVDGVFVPGVFSGNLYSKEVPNLVPAKFKPSVPVVVTRTDSAGTAVAPTLSGDEYKETQEQITSTKKRVTIETEAAPSAPVTLTEYETNEAKQLATVTEVYEAVGSAPTAPTSTTKVQTDNLGNGFQVRRLSTVAALFPETVSQSVQVFQLPEKFRDASATLVKTSSVSAGTTATPASLGTGGTGVLQSTARRKDITVVAVETETLTATPSTNTLYRMVDGQLMTISESIVADDAVAPTVYVTTELLERNVLGGGKAEERIGTVAEVFDRATRKNEQPCKLPEKFHAAGTTLSTLSSVGAGTDPVPNTLGSAGSGVVEAEARRVDATKLELRYSVVDTPASSVTEYQSTKGQLVTVTDSIVDDTSPPSAPTAVTEVLEQHVLGGGKAERRVGVVGSLFPETHVADIGEAAKLDQEIQHFFVDYKRETTSSLAASTTTTPTTLAVPTTVGGLATGIGVISSEKDRTNANVVRTTDTVVSASSLTSLGGFEFDKETGAANAITRQVVAAGTAGGALTSDGTYFEVTPINARFSIKTTRKATVAFNRSYGVWEQVSKLPRVLTTFNTIIFTDKQHRDPYGNTGSEHVSETALHPAADYAAYENPYHINPGGNILHAGFDVRLTDYNGEYFVTVEDQWSNAPFDLSGSPATNFRPQGFSWTTPFGSGNVPECLHDTVIIYFSTGTTHPTYAYIAGSYAFGATSPGSLGGSVVLEHTQVPYLGGWRRIKKTITI